MTVFALGFVAGVLVTFGLAELVGSLMFRRDETSYLPLRRDLP